MNPTSSSISPANTSAPAADNSSLAFFLDQQAAFALAMAPRQGRADLIDAVLMQAFDSFDGNVAIQTEDSPDIECHKGCASCCTLRVTATAPEVLMVARYLRWLGEHPQGQHLGLIGRLAEADSQTRGLNEAQRIQLRERCPFIIDGVCRIYSVRPLACRGHASFNKRECVEAAAGRSESVAISEPHKLVRGLVQNALQSALRDGGYVWQLYELNHALMLAITLPDAEAQWLAGEDPLAEAQIAEVSSEEMAGVFDQIKLQRPAQRGIHAS